MKVVKVAKFQVKIDAGLKYEDLWLPKEDTPENYIGRNKKCT